MKRFYCDQCGDEMTYQDEHLANTNDKTHVVLLGGTLEVTLHIKVSAVTRKPVIDHSSRNHRDPVLVKKEHADLCAPCRWALIEQLRAGHSMINDTPIPGRFADLDWEKPTD